MAQAIVVTTGEVVTEGRSAVPVIVDNTLPAVGPARNVIIAPDHAPRAGGPPLRVANVTGQGIPGVGPALPVYVVGGSLDADPTYQERLIALAPASLIAYWPLSEAAGGTAADASGHGRDGDTTDITFGATGIGDGLTAASCNGTSSLISFAAHGFPAAFSGAAGTFACWARVANAGVWTDGTDRAVMVVRADASNYTSIYRDSGANNRLTFQCITGGAAKFVVTTALGGITAWMHLAMTWNVGADAFLAYGNGTQLGTTQNGLLAWGGVPAITKLGSFSGNQWWSGSLAHAAFWDVALTTPQIAQLATA